MQRISHCCFCSPMFLMRYVTLLAVCSVLLILLLLTWRSPSIFSETDAELISAATDPRDQVTTILHHSWKTSTVPAQFRNYSASWTGPHGCMPGWRYRLWTDEDNRRLVKQHYNWMLGSYDALPSAIHRADVARYVYMHHYGGLYTDLDNECLRPFQHLLANYSIVFGAMKGQYGGTQLPEGYVQNSFMYSRPRQDFWLRLLERIHDGRAQFHLAPVEAITGPIVLSDVIQLYRKLRPAFSATNIKIYPPAIFNPFSWLAKTESSADCRDFGQMSSAQWRSCRASLRARGAYVAQYHAHTWG